MKYISNLLNLEFFEGEKNITCPFHDDKTPSLSVNNTTGVWYCHSCKEGGGYNAFLRKLNLPVIPSTFKNKINTYLNTHNLSKKAIEYLHARGVTDQIINLVSPKHIYNSPADPFNDYLIFPFFQNNEAVYFSGRYIGNDSTVPKYKNLSGVKKICYCPEFNPSFPEIYIVEGLFDVLVLLSNEKKKISNVIGLCGVSNTDISKYLKYNLKINIILDGDNAGYKSSERLVEFILTNEFYKGEPIFVYRLPEGTDPATENLDNAIIFDSHSFILQKTLNWSTHNRNLFIEEFLRKFHPLQMNVHREKFKNVSLSPDHFNYLSENKILTLLDNIPVNPPNRLIEIHNVIDEHYIASEGHIFSLCAYGGVGKTTFILNIIARNFFNRKIKQFFLLLENSMNEIIVKFKTILTKYYPDTSITTSNLHFQDNTENLNPESILRTIRDLKNNIPDLAVVYIDHLDMIDFTSYSEQSKFLSNLKVIARNSNIIIVLVVQALKESGKSDKSVPIYKGSSMIYTIADLFVYLIKGQFDTVNICIDKNRNGKKSSVSCAFDGFIFKEMNSFIDMGEICN